mgnify:FL=1
MSLVSSNPVRENLILAIKNPQQEKIYLDVFSPDGKLVSPLFSGTPALSQTLNLSTESLAAGVYLLRLQSNSVDKTLRFVVAK